MNKTNITQKVICDNKKRMEGVFVSEADADLIVHEDNLSGTAIQLCVVGMLSIC
jgi:hypothetical protein